MMVNVQHLLRYGKDMERTVRISVSLYLVQVLEAELLRTERFIGAGICVPVSYLI